MIYENTAHFFSTVCGEMVHSAEDVVVNPQDFATVQVVAIAENIFPLMNGWMVGQALWPIEHQLCALPHRVGRKQCRLAESKQRENTDSRIHGFVE